MSSPVRANQPVHTDADRRATTGQLEALSCADNLSFMASLGEGCCDLIYVDPPFNVDRIVTTTQPSSPRFDDRHAGGLSEYLSNLELRLAQMHRLLSDRGSLYVHLDWRVVHYVKVMLDRLFGVENFLNEIVWSYRTGGRSGRWFARKHDTILFYAKNAGEHTFHQLRDGEYRTRDLCVDEQGRRYKSTRKGRIYFHADGPTVSDVWDIPFLSTVSKERTGYPTQKPEALLARVIQASSIEGDTVGDFYCGSGTTLAVAKRMGRRWIGCDSNPEAVEIAERRLERTVLDLQPSGGVDDGPSG